MSLTDDDIQSVCALVHELCGIYLDDSKGYLIESRLADLRGRSGCESYAELARRARDTANESLRDDVVNAITTNETLFFRDESPFEALRHKVIPELLDARESSLYPNRLRIWSAACSTGQEPYSIAMLLRELIPDVDRYDIQILGTDVSDAAIGVASRGCYSPLDVGRGLPPAYLDRYFEAVAGGWRVRDEVRSLVAFQRLNLMKSLSHLGPFDVVFCRNVAIYFEDDVKTDLFRRIAERMKPDGVLFVGSSESLGDLADQYVQQHHCRATLYRLRASVEQGLCAMAGS